MFLYYIYSERTDGRESIFIFIIEYTAIVTNTLVGGGGLTSSQRRSDGKKVSM